MKNSKGKLGIACASAALVLTALTGCSGSKVFTVCLASEPATIDPALNSAVDGATLLVHLDSGLYRYVQKDGAIKLEYDLAESITKAKAEVVDHVQDDDGNWVEDKYDEGTRYTVKLRSGLTWSDGSSLKSDDFIYSWNRAASSTLAADYAYMFDPIADAVYHETDDTACPSMAINKIDDLTFTIDVMVDVPYFDQLLAFPTFFPVQEATVQANDTKEDGTWAKEPSTYVSCGAYTLAEWVHDSYILLKANPKYWNYENITMKEIKFALSDDATAMMASYNAGEYQMIDDIPTEQIATLKSSGNTEFHIDGQMGTYYVSFNMNSTKWDPVCGSGVAGEANRTKVRLALGLLINRQDIIDNVAQGGQIAANGFVSKGLTEPDGTQYIAHNGPDHDGKGYYNAGATQAEYQANIDKALTLLQDAGFTYNVAEHKFTNFPKFTYLYNTSDAHKAIAENIKDVLAYYGIEMDLQNQAWAEFLEARKQGQYDVARNGWVADYDDPSSYLTMWTTNSGNNDSQYGRGAHKDYAIYSADVNRDGVKETGLTWAESYDKLIDLSNKESDAKKRFAILHEAEDLLMENGGICPIYYYTDLYMLKSNVKGFFSSPLGYKFFMYSTLA